jgi:hypothetical protein
MKTGGSSGTKREIYPIDSEELNRQWIRRCESERSRGRGYELVSMCHSQQAYCSWKPGSDFQSCSGSLSSV